jgi:hypothetical protein
MAQAVENLDNTSLRAFIWRAFAICSICRMATAIDANATVERGATAVGFVSEVSVRGSWKGSPDDFFELFNPHAQANGANWVKFDEHKDPAKAKTKGDWHTKTCNLDYLKIARDAQRNLSFNRSTVNQGVSKILTANATAWKVKKENFKEYIETVERRIMNMNRKVIQATRKPARLRASWAAELPWMPRNVVNEDVAGAATEAEDEDVGDPDNKDGATEKPATEKPANEATAITEKVRNGKDPAGYSYITGFDIELKLAWRRSVKKGARKQLCDWCGRLEHATDDDPIFAKWPDGFETQIQQISNVEFEELQQGRTNGANGAPIEAFWEGEQDQGPAEEGQVHAHESLRTILAALQHWHLLLRG